MLLILSISQEKQLNAMAIDPYHKSHSASDKRVHISVKNGCIVGYGIGTLWDFLDGSLDVLTPCVPGQQ